MELVKQLLTASERCGQDEEAAADFKRVIEAGASKSSEESEELLLSVKALLDPNSSAGQALLEHVGWDLPVVIVRYVGISDTCKQLTLEIIHCLATSCPPREILATFLEALHVYDVRENLDLFTVLLQGISSVLPRIQRRRAEFAKEAVVGLLSAAFVAGDEGCQYEILDKLFQLCQSIQLMCESEKALDQKELLRKTLVSFVLVLLSSVAATEIPTASQLYHQLLGTLKSFGLTASALLDRSITSCTAVLNSEDVSAALSSAADCGAALAASALLSEDAQDNGKQLFLSAAACFDALNLSKSLFISVLLGNGSWRLAAKGVELIQTVLSASGTACVMDDDQATSAATIFPLLQILQEAVVRSPSPSLRKSTYDALLSILRRISAGAKFLCLLYLVSNEATHPSVVSLLLTFAKDEIHNSWPSEGRECNPFISGEVLELVETILRPQQGGPPKLPDHLDAVVSALNLYRFLLLREKSGGTNYTGVRSKDELVKAKSEWLLPLGSAIAAMPSWSTEAPELDLLIDSLQMIRCRCLELVETELEGMK